MEFVAVDHIFPEWDIWAGEGIHDMDTRSTVVEVVNLRACVRYVLFLLVEIFYCVVRYGLFFLYIYTFF